MENILYATQSVVSVENFEIGCIDLKILAVQNGIIILTYCGDYKKLIN